MSHWKRRDPDRDKAALTTEQRNLVLDHLHLARIFVRTNLIPGTLPASMSMDDCIQIGAEELVRAAKRFKPGGAAKFSTYARACLEKRILGRISEERFGPSAPTLSKWKKQGKSRPPDMVSYDSFTEADEVNFIDTVAAEGGEEFLRRIDPKMAEKVLDSLDKVDRKKLDKRSQTGETGIVWVEREKKYRAYINVLNKQNFTVGAFATVEEAKSMRDHFISDLRELCQDIIWTGLSK